MAFGKIAGKMGDFVVVEGRSGLTLRKKATYRKAVSPRQRAASDRLKAASALWNELTGAQAQAWNRYAETLTHHNPLTGEAYVPIGYNVFTGLAMRILQVDPSATVPLLPPSGTFMGDGIIVEVGSGSPSFRSGERKGSGDGESNPSDSLPLAPSLASERGGTLTFVSSGPNAPGVVTELLIQRLKNERRSPTAQYNGMAFVAFGTGHLTADVPVEPGIYACAVRFTERATGRTTGLQTLGVVTVA